jgi:hypothetical protein
LILTRLPQSKTKNESPTPVPDTRLAFRGEIDHLGVAFIADSKWDSNLSRNDDF